MSSRAIVHIAWGPQSMQKAVLEAGAHLSIGSSDKSGLLLAHAPPQKDTHAELSWDGSTAVLRAVSPGDHVILGGQEVAQGTLIPGQWFKVGDTTLILQRERFHAPQDVPAPVDLPQFAQVLAALRTAENPYAVLDTARDDTILTLLKEAPDETQSLYDGTKGDALAEVAPYLVRLDRQGWLLDALVSQGWGQSWGIYLDCPLSFKELRRHLRRFLRVQQEGSPDLFYFRFYDPRVLRIFLPTCTAEQLDLFYGPICRFWAEDPSGQPLELRHR